ncbi:MAG: tRNA (adenosine(37)-N6)-threonylcarbamoyltransferase complex dimerization subunit type 1 TsaB [Christensenellales bacterium]|jgi:tRNA threonylcarbamoyladenosine biosynthesis protein TsaB
MVILALDTTGKSAGVAVMKDSRLISEIYIDAGLTHSATIMPAVEQALDMAGQSISGVDVFAAAIGPGSFTGIRIGVAAAKAMAQARNKPLAAVNALDALARNAALFEGSICPVMDARRSQVYGAVYKSKGGHRPERLSDYMAVPIDEFLSFVSGRAVFLGDGALPFKDEIEAALGQNAVFADAAHMLQRASSVALEAADMALEGKLISCFEMEPFYIRPSQAERLFGGAV